MLKKRGKMPRDKEFVLWFEEIGIEDIPLVGGKNASLGEMYRELRPKGVNIPNGFATTANAYRYFVKRAGVEEKIRALLNGLNIRNVSDLAVRGRMVRHTILGAEFPEELKIAITEAYKRLCRQYGAHTDVAVRSSATAEDLPDASFAGQQETYLNIRGEAALLEACKKCIASLFTNRAIVYRAEKKFDHFKIALSIGVQKMVRSDKACSGVIFTLDTESGFRDVVLINTSYGLGENIVQGAVNPDQYYIFKPTLKQGFKPIISKKVGTKKVKLVYSEEGNRPTKNVVVPYNERKKFCLTDNEILTLAKWACTVEEHYSKKAGYDKPMDLEWAKDGITNSLFLLQARPETVHSQKDKTVINKYVLKQKSRVIASGESVGEKIGQGKAHIIKDVHKISEFRPGEILVTDMTDPDWVQIMKIASAIVTNRGGRICHAAIISRELGIPCVVGTNDATEKIRTGQAVTVSCAEGETGKVYEGLLKYVIEKIDLKALPKTKTKVMMNISQPERAFEQSFIPNDGVGLAREEFIINSYIKIHPMALINYSKFHNLNEKRQIEELTFNYKDKRQFFIDKLAEGIATIAAAFYPKDVIVRFSDFKSNEYANLLGGHLYEPSEDNPMIGWRGASRYYSPNFRQAFALECKAVKKVREEMGLFNVKVMVPFCRTIEEAQKVIKEMEKNGLQRGKNKLQVYVMCEIPSNVILAEEFAKIFDGFSIGSNDLTQLTLGLDRDSELLSHIFDERNEAVKKLIKHIIDVARKKRKKVGICGDAPSTYPEFAEFLIDCGIDSVSLNPDTIMKTTLKIAEEEKKLINKRKKR
jgi:pyruvate,water dikinase